MKDAEFQMTFPEILYLNTIHVDKEFGRVGNIMIIQIFIAKQDGWHTNAVKRIYRCPPFRRYTISLQRKIILKTMACG